LENCFLYFLLGPRELDIILRGLLVVICCNEITAAVCYPVTIGQELLLVAEISLEYIRLFLRVEYAYLLP
jgi:hypothetical protein